MSIRIKTLIIVGLTILALISVVQVISNEVIGDSFLELEREGVKDNVRQAVSALTREIDGMQRTVADWAPWDDTYEFVSGEYENYPEDNLSLGTVQNLSLNEVLFYDAQGQLFYATENNPDAGEKDSSLQGLIGFISANDYFVQYPDINSATSGLIIAEGIPFMIASHPILHNDFSGPAIGTLVMSRHLDSAQIDVLAEITDLSLAVETAGDSGFSDRFAEAASLLTEGQDFVVVPLSDKVVVGYALMRDINDAPALIIQVEVDRSIYAQGKDSTHLFIWLIVGVCAGMGILVIILLEMMVIRRISALSRGVGEIGKAQDPSKRLSITGRDEVGQLSNAVNLMLDELDRYQQETVDRLVLEKAHTELQIMVEDRTKELAETNSILEQQIENRKAAEAQIRISLAEKEVLLKEIHHRVKNNLQVVSSLINLQKRNITDKESKDLFEESGRRVLSMALIHEQLYQSGDLAKIDFRKYLRSLAENLIRTYANDSNRVSLNIEVDEIFLNIDTAIPCGLMVNELITNSLKYAFPQDWQKSHSDGYVPAINIGFGASDDQHLILVVADNGIGLPEDIDISNAGTLGLQLVSSLSSQLKARIEIESQNGTIFRIEIPSGEHVEGDES